MNYDHLLTRVFDKKCKKMYYVNDQDFHIYDSHKIHRKDYDYSFEDAFLGIQGEYLFYSLHDHEGKGERTCTISRVDIVDTIEKDDYRYMDYECYIKDRYIPMLCTAYKDKNEKLIYEHDIIKTSAGIEYVVERYESAFIANGIENYILLGDLLSHLMHKRKTIEISGNVHEHLNPLEKESNNDKRSPKTTKSN